MLNKKYFLVPLAFVIAMPSAFAGNCTDLKSCAKIMGDLFSQTYIWEVSNDALKFGTATDIEITKQTGELVFTALLDQNGLARAPVGDGKTFRIVRSAFRKEMETVLFDASADSEPSPLPNTWDIVTMRYKVKSPEVASYIEGMFRLNLPRESRMQADDNTGTLMVTAPAPTVRHMHKLIKGADLPLTNAMKEKMRERERERRVDLAKMKQEKSKE